MSFKRPRRGQIWNQIDGVKSIIIRAIRKEKITFRYMHSSNCHNLFDKTFFKCYFYSGESYIGKQIKNIRRKRT